MMTLRVGTPDTTAARMLVPIAYNQRPNMVRLRTNCVTIARDTAMTMETESRPVSFADVGEARAAG